MDEPTIVTILPAEYIGEAAHGSDGKLRIGEGERVVEIDLARTVLNSRICSIDGCSAPFHARGWCHNHYRSWLQYGDPLTARHRSRNSDSYNAVHLRLRSKRGSASKYPCVDCGKPAQEWSCPPEKKMISDTPRGQFVTYSTDPNVYEPRCKKCHRRLDPAVGERNSNAVLTEEIVRSIRTRFAQGKSKKALAAEIGVSRTTVRAIVTGKTWKHI